MSIDTEILHDLTEKLAGTSPPGPRPPGRDFQAIRTRTRGAIIAAHRDLAPRDGYIEADDKMLDLVTAWLDNLGSRA